MKGMIHKVIIFLFSVIIQINLTEQLMWMLCNLKQQITILHSQSFIQYQLNNAICIVLILFIAFEALIRWSYQIQISLFDIILQN